MVEKNYVISENDEIMLNLDDNINVFLKVRKPAMEDKEYYELDENKNIFTLYDQLLKSPSEKSKLYEMDKIFTNSHENSYIYEEICRNCIKESLEGNNFCFISYGETTTDKMNILYGNIENCYSNINTRGIFPRLLEQYIKTISSKEEYKNNYSLNLSSMCINGGKVIDLSQFMGKDIGDLDENIIYNSGFNIDNNKEILHSIKKIPTENVEEVLFFLNKVFAFFEKIEFESKYHLFTFSHFIFNIYITDNNGENISNLIFIILNGSEQLSILRKLEKKEDPKKKNLNQNLNQSPNKKHVEMSKNAVMTQYTYNYIINYINRNRDLNKLSEEQIKEEEEDKTMPKLIILLYNICFGPQVKKMKFRIIGSIIPNTGFYINVKDTLDFLFRCKSIIRKKKQFEGNKQQLAKKEKEVHEKKDDIIFDLENKIKIQSTNIEDLNKRLNEKDNKLREIELTYKKQVEILKKKFNFNGDINILLSGNEYTKEARFAKNIREATDNVRIYHKKIIELEEKLKLANEKIKKTMKEKEIIENDKTMVTYYQNLKLNQENHDNETKLKKEYSERIDNAENQLNKANKIINELKLELEKKNKIIMNLPSTLQNNMKDTFNKKNIKEENKKLYDEKLKKKISEIEEQNSKEIKNLTDKYENLLQQKDLTIKGNNKAYDALQLNYNMEVKNYNEELVRLDEILMNMITTYKSLFHFKNGSIPNLVTMTNLKNEFDKVVSSVESNINNLTYPLLFRGLIQLNKVGIHNTDLLSKKQLKRPKTSYSTRVNNINNENTKNILNKNKSNNHINFNKDNIIPPSEEKIKQFFDKETEEKKVLFSKEKLDKMEKEDIINHCLNLNKKVNEIENYFEKYTLYKKGYDVKEFEYNEKHVENLYEKIRRLNKNIDEQVEINNKNKIIIESQNRSIINLKNENLLLRNQLEGKEINDKISFPILNNSVKNILTTHNLFNTKVKTTNNNNLGYTTTNENSKLHEIYRISSNPNRVTTTVSNKNTFQQITSYSSKAMNIPGKKNKMKRPASATNIKNN